MACHSCNNEKSKLDELVAWMVKIGDRDFNPASRSPEGQKSMKALLGRLDVAGSSLVKYEGHEWIPLTAR